MLVCMMQFLPLAMVHFVALCPADCATMTVEQWAYERRWPSPECPECDGMAGLLRRYPSIKLDDGRACLSKRGEPVS